MRLNHWQWNNYSNQLHRNHIIYRVKPLLNRNWYHTASNILKSKTQDNTEFHSHPPRTECMMLHWHQCISCSLYSKQCRCCWPGSWSSSMDNLTNMCCWKGSNIVSNLGRNLLCFRMKNNQHHRLCMSEGCLLLPQKVGKPDKCCLMSWVCNILLSCCIMCTMSRANRSRKGRPSCSYHKWSWHCLGSSQQGMSNCKGYHCSCRPGFHFGQGHRKCSWSRCLRN